MIDVLIAGGGPNGLMLARELALAGVRPVVLERLTEPDVGQKANGLVGQVVRVLDQRGLLDAFAAEAVFHGPVPRFPFAAMTLELDRLGDDNPLWTMPIPQRTVERLLGEEVAGLGIEVRRGHEVTGFAQDPAGVDVTVRGPDGEYPVRAAYLVGCDGGKSVVRKLAGIEFPGHTRETGVSRSGWVVLDDSVIVPGTAELELPGVGRIRPGTFTRTERGVFAAASFRAGTHLVMAMEPHGRAEGDEPGVPSLAELRAACDRVLGTHLPIVRLADGPAPRRNTEQHTRQADRYREGRVLLAGDAAHVHSAIGGPGLNLGLQDVVNLGWKLAAAVRGWAPEGLLDTYQSERQPVGRRVVVSSLAQLALLSEGPEVTALREVFGELLTEDVVLRRIAGLMSGAETRYPMPGAAPHPLLGRWLPDLKLSTPSGPVRLAELLRGPGALLLDFTGAHPLPGDWGDRVRHVPAETLDPPADALLVRPDGYVAWAGGAGLDEALRTWCGDPGGTAGRVAE